MAKIGVTAPWVMETSTTTGTGTYTLAGAVTGYYTFGNEMADGDTCYYAAVGVDANGNPNGDGREEGYGTLGGSETTLARTTILRSTNSNNAVNWGAGTRRIILLDLPSKSKGLNAVIHGIALPHTSFPRIQAVNVATGDNDLYTVPAGRRCYLLPSAFGYNNSAGSITAFMKIKVSGTYYRIGTNVTGSTNTAMILTGGMILEPGDIVSVNVATTNGFNLSVPAIEFDSVAPFYSPRLLTLTTGNQTVYTCPTGKTAFVYSNAPVFSSAGTVQLVGDGTGHNTIWYLVPSGQAVGTNYKLLPSTAIPANTRQSSNFGGILTAGDFVAVNVNVGAPPIAWLNVLEIGN